MADRQNFSKAGTARALVLLASGLAVGGAALLCVFFLLLADRLVLAAVAFLAFALVSAIAAVLLTFRARSLRRVVGLGCGTLLVGVLIGLAVMLWLVARLAGHPA